MTYELWILLTGALVGVTCGMMGCFLILRKMAMLADAISHTVLLGLVLAFLISQSLNGGIMLIGAAAAGLFTTYLIQVLNAKGIQEDASIGVVFTTLFAIGVILISLFAQNVHLDVEHALMGEIAFIPWDTVMLPVLGEVPKSVVMLTAVLLLDIVVVLLLFKEFKLTSFDPGMAAAMGFPILLLHYVMMTLVSVTTVSAFDSVGAILVVAMLIAPGATAYLWTDRYLRMILLSVIIGIFDSIAGYYAAKWLDVSISGSMAVVAGLVFLLTWILSPRHGLMARFSVLRAGRG
ncbi:metal ABC transporter permease [Rossellomorea marisflavi]|uniref:Iron ABC transporter n=1 Tax=Rossellomorea marisflavi TaxID=189381 RepID=A0A0J5VA03_9BACI|nr:metal ABC transporter permease [Rossellomorea marisflavi]KMK93550.1 iron ABC transporter [Rossellomorea marisflavi]KML01515.1 iron ABC transporter [Rossellomorea marisflavi]KML34004.1 iron ABC transporter [Rossellomorea marisflavi]KZE45542.1 iron ABC transporter [Rossellomorea marisflavi]MCM2604941.1 metal ABC transporter permease [Rossellomorea marisflavi]